MLNTSASSNSTNVMSSSASSAMRPSDAIDMKMAGHQPGYIDTMWMSAFLENTETKKKKISHHTKQQRILTSIKKLPKVKGVSNHKLKTHLKPYVNEMIRNDKPIKYKPSPSPFPKFKSYHLEKIFETQTKENIAASKIQKCWLYSKYIYFLRYTCIAIRKVVQIQRMIRGYLCRKRVALFYTSKTILTIKLQSHIRKWLSNLQWKRQYLREMNAAKRLQRFVRKKIQSSQEYTSLLNQCAMKIQCLWRGLVARTYTDRLWLDIKVILIQKHMRKYLATKYVKYIRKTYIYSANKIKSAYRHYYCCKLLAAKLIDREKNYRSGLIAALTAEENLLDENLTKLAARFLKYNYKENIKVYEKNMKKSFYEIDLREHDYAELKRQKDILSPFAIQQGWVTELEQNTATTKAELLVLKQKYIFESVRNVEEACYDSEKHSVEILELISRVRSLELWKTQEIEDRLEWNFKRDTEQKRYHHRMAIGEEKQKWTVNFFTHSGKPDITTTIKRQQYTMRKKRNNINYNNGSDLFQGGAKVADIFAKFQQSNLYNQNNNNNKNNNNTNNTNYSQQQNNNSTTIDDRINNHIESVNLQTFQNQVDIYAELLKPISSVLERSVLAQPRQLGFGQDGVEYAHAIHSIQDITKGATSNNNSISGAGKTQQLYIEHGTSSSSSSRSSLPSSNRRMDNNNISISNQHSLRPLIGSVGKRSSLLLQLHKTGTNNDANNNTSSNSNSFFDDGNNPSLMESSLSSSSLALSARENSNNFDYGESSSRRKSARDDYYNQSEVSSSSSSSSSSTMYNPLQSKSNTKSSSNTATNSSSSLTTTSTAKIKKIKFHRHVIKRQQQQHRNNNNTPTNNTTNGRTIPWDLLDELDGEKKKFEMERFSTAMNLKLI